MRLHELLATIGREIHTIAHDVSVEEAVRLMTEKNTGALLIVERGEPVGVFAENDLARAHMKCVGRPLSEIRIHDVMTRNVIAADSEDDLGVSIDRMLQSRIGYLPVVKEGRLIGVLLLRDLMRHRIESLSAELSALHEYLSDLQNAAVD
jgi:CBS domain-containing protein